MPAEFGQYSRAIPTACDGEKRAVSTKPLGERPVPILMAYHSTTENVHGWSTGMGILKSWQSILGKGKRIKVGP